MHGRLRLHPADGSLAIRESPGYFCDNGGAARRVPDQARGHAKGREFHGIFYYVH